MVGGEKEEFEHACVILNAMGKKVFHTGKPGSGEIAKIVNNMLLGINMIAASEALAIADKMGMDLKVQKAICDVSSGRSFVMDSYNPVPHLIENSPSNLNYDVGFQCALIKKDMGLTLESAKAAGADTTMLEKAMEYYQELEDLGYGNKDLGFSYQYIHANKKLPKRD